MEQPVAELPEEASVTMLDVLEEQNKMEEQLICVLGGSDDKCCTYARGIIQRQALYSCLTCCPEARTDITKSAGICLACSYRCHENHELVELYTKRNFRCDCPTERMGENLCVLNASLPMQASRNETNSYNQNFQGLYCKCQRPYPDPESTIEEVMAQCTTCEDWYHIHHMNLPAAAAKLVDNFDEMICDSCMERFDFLQDYTGLALRIPENIDDSAANITVTGDISVCEDNDNKLKSDLDKSISEIMNMSETDAVNQSRQRENDAATDVEEPDSKRQKLDEVVPVEETPAKNNCRRPTKKLTKEQGATFWLNGWRAALCQCEVCMALYKAAKIEFLIDDDDTVKSYEDRGRKRAADEVSPFEKGMTALASYGRVQQIDAITEYNRMRDKLKEFLQTFAVTKQIVTEADINRFFSDMRNEKNASIGQPHFCR